ncbi:MAG: AEC family transporter [Propionibacteriaceae bacterium]|jgi:predicted permease|nr:AEC family transporter [Propionibacteriaceae bacterium]
MLQALTGLVVIAVPIAVGYLAARMGPFGADSVRMFNLLAFYVLIPFLLFSLMATANLHTLFSTRALVSGLAAVAMFAAYALIGKFVFHETRGPITVGALASGYTNANFIGLPIATHLLGDATLVAPVILMQTALFAPVALTILESCTGGKQPWWKTIMHGVLNPIVLASVGGLAISLLGVQLPQIILEPLKLIGNGAIPVVLIAFGISLRGRKLLTKGSRRRETVTAVLLKSVGMPLTAFALGHAFGLDAHGIYTVTMLAGLPAAQNVFNYASRYNQSLILARDSLSLTTLATPAVVLVIAALLG